LLADHAGNQVSRLMNQLLPRRLGVATSGGLKTSRSELLAGALTHAGRGGRRPRSFDWLLDLAAGLRGPERQHLLVGIQSVLLFCSAAAEQLAGLWAPAFARATPLAISGRALPLA